MQLISVNLGQAQPIPNAKDGGTTGIYKHPVSEPVQITSAGLSGDTICDSTHHGGVDQAVYIYGTTDYAWWSALLERELVPGIFGENLTITALESARSCIGDRFHVGSVILEVTAPRIPCVTLAVRMGDPFFVKRFREAERPGLYCRVVREGSVRLGDQVIVERYEGETIPAIDLFRDFYATERSEAAIRRYLAAPIAARARAEKEAQLQELLANHE